MNSKCVLLLLLIGVVALTYVKCSPNCKKGGKKNNSGPDRNILNVKKKNSTKDDDDNSSGSSEEQDKDKGKGKHGKEEGNKERRKRSFGSVSISRNVPNPSLAPAVTTEVSREVNMTWDSEVTNATETQGHDVTVTGDKTGGNDTNVSRQKRSAGSTSHARGLPKHSLAPAVTTEVSREVNMTWDSEVTNATETQGDDVTVTGDKSGGNDTNVSRQKRSAGSTSHARGLPRHSLAPAVTTEVSREVNMTWDSEVTNATETQGDDVTVTGDKTGGNDTSVSRQKRSAGSTSHARGLPKHSLAPAVTTEVSREVNMTWDSEVTNATETQGNDVTVTGDKTGGNDTNVSRQKRQTEKKEPTLEDAIKGVVNEVKTGFENMVNSFTGGKKSNKN
ncbi:uncharacterized protein LOC131931345 isoform X2 [Physella acuta]|uniref:uncharacterized protein LOC131931345 isoform X2 n=1 Tax=Physella acuta TaxID=109671 RepID=UPI0027DAED69|nr:uncharacterized protein LOC131931345 isoform X2 [Physella acuta]